MSGTYWTLMTILGPIVLLLVIGFALLRQRRLTAREQVKQHDAVEDVYQGGEGGEHAHPRPPR